MIQLLHQSPRQLILGVSFYHRFYLLGFGLSLGLLSAFGLLQLWGGAPLAVALLLPLLGGLLTVGILAVVAGLRQCRDVYEPHRVTREQGFLGWTRTQSLAPPVRWTQEAEEPIRLESPQGALDLSGYDEAVLMVVKVFLSEHGLLERLDDKEHPGL